MARSQVLHIHGPIANDCAMYDPPRWIHYERLDRNFLKTRDV